MKTLLVSILMSGIITACGGPDLNTESVLGLPGSGVGANGHCDKVLVKNRALLTRDADANDYIQLAKDCESFMRKYPNTSCSLTSPDPANNQSSVNTADMKKDCADTVERIKISTTVHSTPTPTPTPTPSPIPN
jgi:hypothetical protein